MLKPIRFVQVAAATVAALMLSSCDFVVNATVPSGGSSGNGGSGGTTSLSCSASLVANAAVASGASTSILVQATGGSGVYQISGVSGNFTSNATLSQTFTNNTSSSEVETDTITVTDTSSDTTTCNVSVTVLPASSTTAHLACTITALVPTVHFNDPVTFSIAYTVGTPVSESFSSGGGTTTQVLTALSPTQATAQASYSMKGNYTPTVTISDASGNQANCSTIVSVLGTPSVAVVPSPASGSQVNNLPINLVATPTNFFGTPTYTFKTTESGITIVPSGNTAVVTATDGNTHNFYVTVTATSVTATNNDSAFYTIYLQFTSSVPLTCTISPSAGPYALGQPITYTVTGTQPVELTQFTSYGKVQSQPSPSSVTVIYSTPGQENVSALAVATATGVQCNGGATLENNTVNIVDNLSCTATVTPSSTVNGTALYVTATVPAGYATNSVQIIDVTTYSNAYLYIAGLVNNLEAEVAFYYTPMGNYPLTVTVEDSNGTTATCVTTPVTLQN